MLRSHLWMSQIKLSGQQERKQRINFFKRKPLHTILVQSGTLFLESGRGFKNFCQKNGDITGNDSDGTPERFGTTQSSDEGNPYRDAGGLGPVLRGVMRHHMFHQGVFRHVLYKVGLLEHKREREQQL